MTSGGMCRAGAPRVAMLLLLGLSGSAVHVHAHDRLAKVAWAAPKADNVKSASTPVVRRARRTQARQHSTHTQRTDAPKSESFSAVFGAHPATHACTPADPS